MYTQLPISPSCPPAEARPCVDCGTPGGYCRPGVLRPCRTRGRCQVCYLRARATGTIANLPPKPPPPPCIDCGTPGGYCRPDRQRPERRNGRCNSCHLARRHQQAILAAKNRPEPKPCIDCGTPGGARHPKRPLRGPTRRKGRCAACHRKHMVRLGQVTPTRYRGISEKELLRGMDAPGSGPDPKDPSRAKILAACAAINRDRRMGMAGSTAPRQPTRVYHIHTRHPAPRGDE